MSKRISDLWAEHAPGKELEQAIQEAASKKEPVAKGEMDKKEREEAQRFTAQMMRNKYTGMLHRQSLFSEKNVLNHHFKEIEAPDEPTKRIAKQVRQFAGEYANGSHFNLLLMGRAGAGKTLLASCLMNYVNDHSPKPTGCLFISVPLLYDLALARSRGDDIRKREQMNHVEKAIRQAELLVLDDLGSESNMQSDFIRQASNFTQRILFEVADSRIGKMTVITTNYTGEELQNIYESKIISRLMPPPTSPEHVINFDELPDRRILQN